MASSRLPSLPPPTWRSPKVPALARPTPHATLTIGATTTALDGINQQHCRMGEALQTFVKKEDGGEELHTFIIHAPSSSTAMPRRVTVMHGENLYPATLQDEHGVRTLTLPHVTLSFQQTTQGLMADRALGLAGCFHTGSAMLSPGKLDIPLIAMRDRTSETYTFHAELSEIHAITVMVFLPDQRFKSPMTFSASLKEVFKDPRGAQVRVFFEERKVLQDAQGSERYTWTQIPAQEGELSLTLEGERARPTARLSLTQLVPPDEWTYPRPTTSPLMSLTGHTSIIMDPRGKLIPSPYQNTGK